MKILSNGCSTCDPCECICTRKHKNYYDVFHQINTAGPVDPVNPDSPVYNKEKIHPTLCRNADIIYVTNYGCDILYIRESHCGTSDFQNETPIFPGTARSFYNIFEIRLRSPIKGLQYSVSEYDIVEVLPNLCTSGNVIQVSGQPVSVSGNIVQISGQQVEISGQPVTVSGNIVLITNISGQCLCANISGQPVSISGQPVSISGQPVSISGQPVSISGQPVTVSGNITSVVNASGTCLCVGISGSPTVPTSPISDFNTVTGLGATESSIHELISSDDLTLTTVEASASGAMKVEVGTGFSGSISLKMVAFTSDSNPTVQLMFNNEVQLTSGQLVQVTRTNREIQAMDVYSTILGFNI